MDIAAAINQYGFPIIATFGMGYFIYYIWTWVTEQVDPILNESHMTLIGLIAVSYTHLTLPTIYSV